MILITGGTGFIGRYIARSLADEGRSVLVTYRRSFQVPDMLKDVMGTRVKSVRCDVLDLPNLVRAMRDHKVESVIHAAHVSPYEASLYQVVTTGVQGAINVLEAASLSGVRKVSFISSASIQRLGTADGFTRTSRSAIDAVKKAGEVLLSYLGKEYSVQVSTIRPPLIYGPYCESEIEPQRILRDMVEGAARGRVVDLSSASTGKRLDWVYVADCGHAIAAAHVMPASPELIEISSGKLTSFQEIADILKEFVPSADIRLSPDSGEPAVDSGMSDQSTTTAPLADLKYGMREGLREYLEWYRSEQANC